MRPAALICMAVLALGASPALAQVGETRADRLSDAALVLRESRSMIPDDLWTKARCVAVIPDMKKAAFIFGGEYGKGVLSCRAGEGWSAPVFIQLAKGSWGFQAGAEEIDLVLLVMNESGVQKMMRNKVSLGADASVAAGPVGRQGQVGTDVSLTAEILAYSRAKGLFAGINVSGGVLRPDEDANEDAYGPGASPSTILASTSISAPTEATGLLQALRAADGEPATAASTTASPSRTSARQTASGATSPDTDTDTDVRAQLVAMQQTVDRMLADAGSAPVGTSGQTGGGATVTVSRDRLEQLRSQIASLLAALDAR